jgi:crotonobetainyl-CoA:carnitine CoA-transferase CaiB-like acyl-CoA transferase
MNAHAAILQALYARGRDGKGAGIAVSLFDGLADWMAVPLLHQDYGGRAPARLGLAHPSIAPYGAFHLAGGRSIVLSVQNQREWRALCRLLDLDAIADDPRFAANVDRCANRAELDRVIGAALAGLDPEAAVAALKGAGIAFGFVNSVASFSKHPQLRRTRVETPTGPADIPAPPVRWADGDSALGAVPAIDADGAAIRAEFA